MKTPGKQVQNCVLAREEPLILLRRSPVIWFFILKMILSLETKLQMRIWPENLDPVVTISGFFLSSVI